MGQRILVAFDDSENATRAVEFIAKSFTPDHQITLFSVIPDTASICELQSPELIPYFLSRRDTFCAIEDQKRVLVNHAVKEAKSLLVKAGFDENNIHIKITARNRSIAHDIVDEAISGYDTIVLGKRGLSGIKEFFVGSVSQKVLNLAGDRSVVLVN